MARNKMQLINKIKGLVRKNTNNTYYFATNTIADMWNNEKKIPTVLHYVKVKNDVLYICVSDVWLDHSIEKFSDFDIDEIEYVYNLVLNNK